MINRKTTQYNVSKMVMTGLMMAVVTIMTAAIPIPAPFTSGYIHLGDAAIFFSVLLLGWRHAAIAAGIGSAMADLLLGFGFWAPWTLVIKGGMAILMGIFIAWAAEHGEKKIGSVPVYQSIGMLLGGLFMVAGYFLAQGMMYGNFVAALPGIPWNILQFGVGLTIASLMSGALYRSPARRFFTYRPVE